MEASTLILVISLSFISVSESNVYWSTGDPNSKVDRVETDKFRGMWSSTNWKREAGWVGVLRVKTLEEPIGDYERVYANKPEITYEMELFRGPEDQCITTLRSDRFWSVLLEIHNDCSDVTEYVGIKNPVKTTSTIDGNFVNVIHEIYVILKDACLKYSIDSLQGVKTGSSECMGEKAPSGSDLWVKVFPDNPNTEIKWTNVENLQKTSEITRVETSGFTFEKDKNSKTSLEKYFSIFQVKDQYNENKKRRNKFVLYELDKYYIHVADNIQTKLTAWDFNKKITLIEVNNNKGSDPTEYVGLHEPYSDELTGEIIHYVTVVMKHSCCRLKITVKSPNNPETHILNCDSSVPIVTRIWNMSPKD